MPKGPVHPVHRAFSAQGAVLKRQAGLFFPVQSGPEHQFQLPAQGPWFLKQYIKLVLPILFSKGRGKSAFYFQPFFNRGKFYCYRRAVAVGRMQRLPLKEPPHSVMAIGSFSSALGGLPGSAFKSRRNHIEKKSRRNISFMEA